MCKEELEKFKMESAILKKVTYSFTIYIESIKSKCKNYPMFTI